MMSSTVFPKQPRARAYPIHVKVKVKVTSTTLLLHRSSAIPPLVPSLHHLLKGYLVYRMTYQLYYLTSIESGWTVYTRSSTCPAPLHKSDCSMTLRAQLQTAVAHSKPLNSPYTTCLSAPLQTSNHKRGSSSPTARISSTNAEHQQSIFCRKRIYYATPA